MRASTVGFLGGIALTVMGCGRQEVPASDTAYVSWGTDSIRSSTIADARGETVNICLQGSVTAPDLERAKLWAKRAALTWLRAAKVLDERVTSAVALACDGPDLTINLQNGNGTSYASPSVATIYMNRPYGTWTHELGHALAGLGDTYAGGAGSCQSGQPQSLMCWGAYGPRADPDAWSTLWGDDVAGLQSNYRRITTESLTPPKWAGEIDLEAPVDPAAPWPGASSGFATPDGRLDVAVIPGGATPVDGEGEDL